MVVAISIRPPAGQRGKWARLSGALVHADKDTVHIMTGRYPTGPWDKWKPYDQVHVVPRSRIAKGELPDEYNDPDASAVGDGGRFGKGETTYTHYRR